MCVRPGVRGGEKLLYRVDLYHYSVGPIISIIMEECVNRREQRASAAETEAVVRPLFAPLTNRASGSPLFKNNAGT